jgi:hypothetical protein
VSSSDQVSVGVGLGVGVGVGVGPDDGLKRDGA